MLFRSTLNTDIHLNISRRGLFKVETLHTDIQLNISRRGLFKVETLHTDIQLNISRILQLDIMSQFLLLKFHDFSTAWISDSYVWQCVQCISVQPPIISGIIGQRNTPTMYFKGIKQVLCIVVTLYTVYEFYYTMLAKKKGEMGVN